VFAVMLIAALVIFGLISYPRIGVDLFPNVEYPVVTVTVTYPGGDPETMESKISDPIEQAINSLNGIKALRSSNMEGTSQITVEFELEVAIDRAVQDIRDRVSAIQGQLPEGVEAPIVQKFDVGAAPIMSIALAGELDSRALTQLADKVVKERVQRVSGVGGVELIGGRDREIRVAIDASKLSGLGLTVQDVADAIRAQNFSLPAGSFDRGAQEITAKTKGEVKTAQEVSDILLPAVMGGGVRVRDVATVMDTMERTHSTSSLDGHAAIALVVRKQSGANTVAVARAVRQALEEIRPRLTRARATLAVPTDDSIYIARSIRDVQFDLVFGGLLAAAIILVFLRDPRATLISAVAIPTSVIGTFAFMQWLGFSFNNMTMLALSLSIGVLIDDAIVVIENIHRHLERGESPEKAASNGAAQIFLAVLATTSSILAVFVPVATMRGIVGRFFYQFGITVSVAVALSMLVSFTLTPMLSSRFLAASHGGHASLPGRMIETTLRALDRSYGRSVGWALSHRLITLGLAVFALAASLVAVMHVRTEYMPDEDRAQLNLQVELPAGASLAATTSVTEAVAADLRKSVPGVEHTFATVGAGVQGRANLGQIQLTLVPSKQRSYRQVELMAWLRQRLRSVRNANVTVQSIAPMGGQASRAQPIQFFVRGADMNELVRVTDALKAELGKTPGFVDLDTTYRGGKPELAFTVDRQAAASMGVSVAAVASTVRILMAGSAVSEIKDGVDVYDIVVQLSDADRMKVESLANMQVRSSSGLPVDLSNIVHMRRGHGPSQIEREARQRQITVLAGLEGVTLGEATKLVAAAAKRVVPGSLVTGFVGMADTMNESFVAMGVSLLLAVIFVYMILAAQFDSFVQPLTIMLSLPFSLVGAFGALYATGETLNIFSMIGVIMLMGLVTKNAILLVDFANQLRADGSELRVALIDAGIARLRPILMTTAAMVFGMLPVAMALSEGGEVRAPMAICVIGGLLTSMLLTLVVVPVAYSLTESMLHSRPMQWIRSHTLGLTEPDAGSAAEGSAE
jgi:HAE1 family hydrophobic/amphiphilic exporter-1